MGVWVTVESAAAIEITGMRIIPAHGPGKLRCSQDNCLCAPQATKQIYLYTVQCMQIMSSHSQMLSVDKVLNPF